MDRTSAACAMEWSIDLEKGLRSKKPGQSLEAIQQVGLRLEQWDREPAINIAQHNMFGLIPGEDRLFANTILLRLIDAFGSGDKQTKLCVVKVFLLLSRHRRKKRGQHDGIMFKCSLENRLELLRRVKIVFDMGDAESRGLALVLFGCWADVAKDNADIRYLILSSLVSCDVLQVEAALFAGGCFCELSDDFASILLEILANLVTSSETLSTVKLVGVRAFAKMGCSSSHASKAYEAGLKLVLCSSEENLLAAMLISLSKLASKSTCLISGQVALLFSFFTQEKPLHLQATALKCLRYMVERGMCHFPASAVPIKTLVSMLDEFEFPPALQYGALQILHKVLLYNLPTMPCADMLEFSELLTILENATQSSIMVKKLLAIRVLVDILGNFMGKKEKALHGVDSTTLASRIISFVIDQISLLVKVVPNLHQLDSEMEREGQSLLSLLLLLVEKYPDLGGMVLDKICVLIGDMVNKHAGVIIEFRGQNRKLITSKLLLSVSKVVAACLDNFNESGAVTTLVLDTKELLVKHVQQCSSFDYFRDYLVQHEITSLECAKNMLARKDNWSAYKVGRNAAYQGAWFAAAFIFEHLITMVQSNTCCQWLKSLAEFAHSERKVQLLNLPEQGFSLVNCLGINKTARSRNGLKLRLPNKIEILIEACNSLRSLEETMGAIVTTGHALCFQRWFLALRAKVLESVADTLKLYCVPFTQDNIKNDEQVKGNSMVESPGFLQWITSMACSLTQISLRLNGLAREFDLIATSFRGMDKKSFEIISAHAVSCSLLAFSTGFSLFFPNLNIENILGMSEEGFHGMLIQDLVWRLQQIDCETCTKLGLLWRVCRRPKTFFLQSRNQMFNISCEARVLLTVCSYAVTGIMDDENLYQVTKESLQHLLDIISKWMLIPFRTPNHFFRVRPCISSELFASNSNTRSPEGISVLPGFHLSLNLCLQLKNVPVDLPVQLTKLYCILYCRTSFRVPSPGANEGQMQWSCRDDDMVYLNDKLFQFVMESTKKASNTQRKLNAGDCGVVDICVCFEPNEKGQGSNSKEQEKDENIKGNCRCQWEGLASGGNSNHGWKKRTFTTFPEEENERMPFGLDLGFIIDEH
ncbi:hypothetical protein LOK49_LG09G01957 [Camellia lanceoleosa]|uniref:Uncharacterized protein n=1 Tax=Camellia lanceoleosa TaxID=1840588 RepID=A0ACC0GJJ9_9ERIC|nr:hypothetical protein LOK49_LG09G01957 [Camellia lanceoleosa]